ncbi:Bro-N domain-containing protein [uncultured Salipiger sp.]|uniref:BRO-N domain-containing protein n=1 Tax=uncultured Salipiger sp. TaxID=499810 RepID=UPI00259A6CF7|nr:Bro-N domain-containing protein [uncultured Salipiger sp.]
MSAEIIPFDFEEQAVRVVMRGEDPWFVAADVCRVLGIVNTSQAVQRLDEDEVTLCQIEGSHRPTNLLSESGLYALVIRSDKPEAKRFRKWITAEVLPAIRQHGRYELIPTPQPEVGQIAGLPIREAELWLQMVREARLTRGNRAANSIWDRSPLPALTPLGSGRSGSEPQDGRGCLAHLMATLGEEITEARLVGREDPALTEQGIRPYADALFLANFALPVFHGTRWQGGMHRAALMELPNVHPAPGARTLAGVRTRGLALPWRLIDGADVVEFPK